MSNVLPPDPLDLDALIAKLCAEHRAHVVETVARLGKLPHDKAEDVTQEVLRILGDEVEELGKAPPNVRAFLGRTIQLEIRNHRRKEARAPKPGADVDAVPGSAPSPERRAELAEQRRKLKRYLTYLPEAEADAVLCVDILGMTLQEAAEELGLPLGTVVSLRARGWEALKKLARKSAKETEMGLRRRPRKV